MKRLTHRLGPGGLQAAPDFATYLLREAEQTA